ncbi:hypothetical protein [Amycolatopsis deserti]|uniref:hypothetical protein n=1 Tax=Amycolatopsis deserti TaxID=185696 RepID=UPI001E326BC2|nr:hypothetical protein [Amycolatopsis deserti]
MSLVVLFGGTVAVAALNPGSSMAPPAAAQPLPLPTVEPCEPGSPLCSLPAPPTAPSLPEVPLPLPTEAPTSVTCLPGSLQDGCVPSSSTSPAPPCTGEGCIPQPGTTTPPTAPSGEQPDPSEETGDDCGLTNIGACITEVIDGFFRGIVESALNPLLELLSKTLLTTPTPDSLPRVGELWDNSWQILLVSYGLLVLIAGMIVMSYQTIQTRHSALEIAPRLAVGFLAGALSLWVATKGIQIANALVAAIMGGGLDASAAGAALRDLVMGSIKGGMWIVFIGLVLAGLLVALLVTYVVRVALTIILIVAAPLALMFHALPQTEGIAYWWWKAYGGCLAIQLGQSLTLITALKVFFTPGGFTLFGPTASGLINLLVALALMYILLKIPFWILGSIRGGGGRSLIGSLVRGFLAYKTFGLLGGGGGKPRTPRATGGSSRGGSSTRSAEPRSTAGGQYVLPLPGLRRTRPKPKPGPAPEPKSSRKSGRQLALPLGDDWPENKPVLGPGGQHRLPFDVPRAAPPAASTGAAGTSGRRTPRAPTGKQLELPFDPYQGNRPLRSGQYPLPLEGLRKVARPANPPPPPARRGTGRRVVQPPLPFDPYQGTRPTRSGQYPLPLDGLNRVPPKPAPPPPPNPRAPQPGRQLRLPLDLPKPAKTPRPRVTPPPPTATRRRKPGGSTS